MSLKSIAQDLTRLSPLMENREKVSTSDMIKKYPNGFEVGEVDIVTLPDARYAVITPKDDDKIFYTGGLVLTKIVDAWLAVEPDKQQLYKQLDKEKIKLKLKEEKTRGNNNITTVEVI